MSIDLSIIILNYNTSGLLEQTLRSLQTQLTLEVIVVDNASSDDSVAMVKRKFSQVRLIELSHNTGFAAGNNHGIRQATGKYVLLLNSDTKVMPGSLEKCVKYLNKHQDVGILTPKLTLNDGAIDLACHRGFPTPANAIAYFLKLEQLFPYNQRLAGYHQTWQNFDKTHDVDAVSGAAMFIRNQVIHDIGLLDERFFMYAEDIDFCYRAKQAGWRVIYFPKAEVIHYKGFSGSKSDNAELKKNTRRHFYQTMKQYFEKHYANKYPGPLMSLINMSIDLVARIRK